MARATLVRFNIGVEHLNSCSVQVPRLQRSRTTRAQLRSRICARVTTLRRLGSGTYLESIDGSSDVDEILEQTPFDDEETTPSGGRVRKLLRGVITVAIVKNPTGSRGENTDENKGIWKFGRGKGTKTRKIKDGAPRRLWLAKC